MTTSTEPRVDAHSLLGMLRRHHLPDSRPPSGLFATEIGAPDGAHRADALWMPLTETGGGLEGFEVKISRADVANELADPLKADAWARYCSKWWLVVASPDLIAGLTIPDQWGVMSPPSGRRTRTMTVLRPAPALRPHDGGPAFRRLLAWYFHRTHGALLTAEATNQRLSDANERLQQQLRETPTAGLTSPQHQRIADIVRRVEESNNAEHIYGRDDDLIVQAIVDAARVRDATEVSLAHLDRTLNAMKQAVEPVRDVGGALAKVLAGAPPSSRRRGGGFV